MDDSQPNRDDICKFFDENIKIDWTKAPKVDFQNPDNVFMVNGSGHLVIKKEYKEMVKRIEGKSILTEEMMDKYLFVTGDELKRKYIDICEKGEEDGRSC